MTNPVLFQPIAGLPMIAPGDDLTSLIISQLAEQGLKFQTGDVLALAQKIVSKSEGRLVNLATVEPGARANEIAAIISKDPRLVEVILSETREVIWVSTGIFVVETRQGFVCANAGVDRSNVSQSQPDVGQPPAEWVCLLPEDADASARRIKERVKELGGVEIAVLINDTHGRPFRMGNAGVGLGSAGLITLFDQRGEHDLLGYQLQATLTAVGDELAAATSLIMGQADEAVPAVLVRGLPRRLLNPPTDEGAQPLIRPRDKDVFRYPPGSERWRKPESKPL